MDKIYTPTPMELEDVTLSDNLTELIEVMAQNVHDVWAKARMDEGWRYGPERNDSLKTHPDLVPYDDLPEGEKEYDRQTAVSTLKLIIKSGFQITK